MGVDEFLPGWGNKFGNVPDGDIFMFGEADDPAGSGVHVENFPVDVAEPDKIRGGINDGGEAFPLFFGFFAIGDVRSNSIHAEDLTLGVINQPRPRLEGANGAIAADQAIFDFAGAGCHDFCTVAIDPIAIFGMNHLSPNQGIFIEILERTSVEDFCGGV